MRAVLAAALALVPGIAHAQAPCLSQAEAEAITLVAMPDILRETGRVCTALPAASLLRRTSGPFFAKYQTAADEAWPAARRAITKLSDPAVEMLLLSEYARPMLTALLVPQVVGRIVPSDCPTLDRLATLLEPLPARNTAGIVVTTVQYLKAEKAKGNAAAAGVPELPVCTRPR